MSITLPGPLEEVMNLVGIPWVDIDEDDLHALARSLRSYAGELRDHRDAAGRRLASTGADTSSDAYEALVEHWSATSHGHMEAACRVLEDMAGGLDAAGDVVHEVKIGIIGALSVAAAELAADAAAAFFTFGIAAAAEVGIVAIARTAVSRLVSQLEQEVVGRIVGEVFGSMLDDLDDRVAALVYRGAQLIAS